MIPSKKIAGVSVNTEFPPNRKDLVKAALKTKEFYRLPIDEATDKINKEINKSGLYKSVSNVTNPSPAKPKKAKGGNSK